MIISDLNYLEEVNNETKVVGGNFVGFNKNLDSNISTDFEFDVDINIDKDSDVDVNVFSDANVDGNIAEIAFDAEAFGTDTLVDVEVSVLTIEDQLSSVAGYIVSAVN